MSLTRAIEAFRRKQYVVHNTEGVDGEVTKSKSGRSIQNREFLFVGENMKDEVFSEEVKEIVEEIVEDSSTTTVYTVDYVTQLEKGRTQQAPTSEVDTTEDCKEELNEPVQGSSTEMIDTSEDVRELVDK